MVEPSPSENFDIVTEKTVLFGGFKIAWTRLTRAKIVSRAVSLKIFLSEAFYMYLGTLKMMMRKFPLSFPVFYTVKLAKMVKNRYFSAKNGFLLNFKQFFKGFMV